MSKFARQGSDPGGRVHEGLRVGVACLLMMVSTAWAEDPPPDAEELPTPDAESRFHIPDSQLGNLIREALESNPEILSAHAAWRASQGRAPQGKALPDPMLTYRYFIQTPETRVGPQQQAFEMTQVVPWGGKRDSLAQRADHDAAGVGWRVRNLERAVVARLKRAYFKAAYLQEAMATKEEERALLGRFEKIALTRYATGAGIQQNVIKIQTDITRLVDQETDLRARLRIVTRDIARLAGRTRNPLLLRPISVELPELVLDQPLLERESVVEHPSIHAIEEKIRADEAWGRSRRLGSRPDFKFGLGFADVRDRSDPAGSALPPPDNGKDIWSVSVGITLPIHGKKNHAGVTEADESAQSHRHALDATRDQLRYGVQESVLRLESIGRRARLYREVIVPQAGESLASAEAAYRTNRQDVLDLLDAERVLFEVRLTHERLISDYWIALADLEAAVGRRFPDGEARP